MFGLRLDQVSKNDSSKSVPVWNRSVGLMSSKGKLSNLVRPKSSTATVSKGPANSSANRTSEETSAPPISNGTASSATEQAILGSTACGTANKEPVAPAIQIGAVAGAANRATAPAVSALICNYSSSDSDEC